MSSVSDHFVSDAGTSAMDALQSAQLIVYETENWLDRVEFESQQGRCTREKNEKFISDGLQLRRRAVEARDHLQFSSPKPLIFTKYNLKFYLARLESVLSTLSERPTSKNGSLCSKRRHSKTQECNHELDSGIESITPTLEPSITSDTEAETDLESDGEEKELISPTIGLSVTNGQFWRRVFVFTISLWLCLIGLTMLLLHSDLFILLLSRFPVLFHVHVDLTHNNADNPSLPPR